ncbi:MAG: UTP--glucose-1-phosphate uridylyltransferase, partial [Planctomycetes bacterium]|nr:UTP--glucose-1-phosphate uridylyltransferase [Planctomycetota bacterium]
MKHELIEIITSDDAEVRDRSLEAFCRTASADQLRSAAELLDRFRRDSDNLYHRVRALFFLGAIYRYYLPEKLPAGAHSRIPYQGFTDLLNRRFDEAINAFLRISHAEPPSDTICSALAQAYRELAFQTLANQVRRSVRSTRGNQWMFRTGHPSDHPIRVRRELLERGQDTGLYPILSEQTPVRMDLSHSGWSDIFFLG